MFLLDCEVVDLRGRSVRLGHIMLVIVWRQEVLDRSCCDLLTLLYVGSVEREGVCRDEWRSETVSCHENIGDARGVCSARKWHGNVLVNLFISRFERTCVVLTFPCLGSNEHTHGTAAVVTKAPCTAHMSKWQIYTYVYIYTWHGKARSDYPVG